MTHEQLKAKLAPRTPSGRVVLSPSQARAICEALDLVEQMRSHTLDMPNEVFANLMRYQAALKEAS
jgi:hypothetical protein